MANDEVIAKYVTDLQPLYRLFAGKVQELVSSILAAKQIRPHSVTYREKSPASLDGKISRGGKSYEDPLREVTDLAGVRVITYFPTDVDRVVPLLEEQFVVDKANSVDKRMTTDPSAFGYASVHLVVELTPERYALPEYAPFKGLKCEVQVRTILQHAWAEIEHDIVYKSSEEIPFELRRKFASLAGLLEVADREFQLLRQQEIELREQIRRTVTQDNLDIPVNLDSVKFYLQKYHGEDLTRPGHAGRRGESAESSSAGELVRLLAAAGIGTLAELHSVLTGAALKSADNEVARAMQGHPCASVKRCLLRHFVAVGKHAGLSPDVLYRYAHCPHLLSPDHPESPPREKGAVSGGNGRERTQRSRRVETG
jgi:putative GTP pyrophosphokinase